MLVALTFAMVQLEDLLLLQPNQINHRFLKDLLFPLRMKMMCQMLRSFVSKALCSVLKQDMISTDVFPCDIEKHFFALGPMSKDPLVPRK